MVKKNEIDPWEAIIHAFTDTRDVGFAKLNLTADIVDCNKAFAHTMERDPTSTIGLNVIKDLTWPEDQEITRQRFAELASGDVRVVSITKRLRTASGGSASVKLEACRIFVADGPGYIVDIIYLHDEGDVLGMIDKLEAMLMLVKAQGGNTINVTGADMGDRTHVQGGDYTRGNKTTNDQSGMRWLIAGFLGLVAGLAWVMYYVVFIANRSPDTPQTPPAINPQSTETSTSND